MTVQLAKGAIEIGTASVKNERFVRDLGMDEFVDRPKQPFEEVVKDVEDTI
jgi:NADPH:quinone reductase-like Zn-dependent oxidoreductase